MSNENNQNNGKPGAPAPDEMDEILANILASLERTLVEEPETVGHDSEPVDQDEEDFLRAAYRGRDWYKNSQN